MMSNLPLIDNLKVRALGQKLMQLPYVVEVRFFPVIAGEMKDVAGADALLFVTLIRKDDLLRKVFVTVPAALYDDEEKHQITVDRMAEKIEVAISGVEETPPAPAEVIPPTIIPEEVPDTTEE